MIEIAIPLMVGVVLYLALMTFANWVSHHRIEKEWDEITKGAAADKLMVAKPGSTKLDALIDKLAKELEVQESGTCEYCGMPVERCGCGAHSE